MQATIAHRHTPSSPSLAMEKGTYRMRVDQGSPSKLRHLRLQEGNASQASTYHKRMPAVIVLLVLAIAFCFGSAVYLFNKGWVAHSHRPQSIKSNNSSSEPLSVKVVEFDRESGNAATDNVTKYLSYLPHSGFHNQRIAFENALIMARILNRTLLVPPVRLGIGTLTYYPFDHLYELVALSGKDGLGHCANASSWKRLPVECTDYYDYTMVPWNWLSNISSITSAQPTIQRWNMSDAWLADFLAVLPNDTFFIKDSRPYQYRFVDADPLDMPSARFEEVISMSLLSQLPHRLIQVGTLFGSSRLRLRHARNLEHRTLVRQSMTFTNEILLGLAESIRLKMGGEYVAVHIRVGDGAFERKAAKNVRAIWWRLVQEILNVNKEEALKVERAFGKSNFSSVPAIPTDPVALRTPHPPLPPLPSSILPRVLCRRPRHQDPLLAHFNVPLFISTDVQDPASHVLLRRFFDAFPCTFVLSDFIEEVQSLGRLQSGYDGLMLKDFILSFLDAVIAGKAHQVVGTDGSTFSQFLQDVLWRQYKGWNIVQRG
ncbi:hypothetical protein A7U60_g2590 [Sanghuangporus baumii]|uniref:O-fucosyltransferase family protein n=1 Tax=Sanghuangporus baumii TaxID=108892 RepID=A0A9Q5I231_SANBA|nr:hypothetical protein A7U60_g2590 [Sanghuangporus baumii]